MFGHELAVQQGEAAKAHPGRQPGQRHLRRVGPARHHAFAEKGPAQRHAIQPADQFLILPHLDAMGETDLMQVAIGPFDGMIDPGRWPVVRRLRAKPDDAGKVAIGGHAKPIPPDRLGQRMGDVEAVERHDRPPLRLDPINVLRLAIVGHGKHADSVSLQQHQRINGHQEKDLTVQRPARQRLCTWRPLARLRRGEPALSRPQIRGICASNRRDKAPATAIWAPRRCRAAQIPPRPCPRAPWHP